MSLDKGIERSYMCPRRRRGARPKVAHDTGAGDDGYGYGTGWSHNLNALPRIAGQAGRTILDPPGVSRTRQTSTRSSG